MNNFFREIARGGAGIVTVGPVGIDFIGSGYLTMALDKDEYIPSFKKLTDIIKEEGASPWIQLFHAGAYSHPMMIDNQQPKAPSKVFSKYVEKHYSWFVDVFSEKEMPSRSLF